MGPTSGPPASLGWADRVVRLYRAGSAVTAIVALLVANAIPIVGVAFLGWSLITILVLYWIENGIVGFWNVPKIALAEAPATGVGRLSSINGRPVTSMSTVAQRVFAVPFFIVHYGLFWVVHGVFVFVLPFIIGVAGLASDGGSGSFPFGASQEGRLGSLEGGPLLVGAVALFISHGVSFFWNYLARGEYRRASPVGQMFTPYGRLLVLHLTIVLGAWPVVLLGSPIGLLLVLVIGKTALDLYFHLREHARDDDPPA